MFPKDPILMKMIIDEFKESKIAKHPLEYDCFDSDEEGTKNYPIKYLIVIFLI